MNIDELKIGDAKKIAGMFGQSSTQGCERSSLASGEMAIVVADRGWVWVGTATQESDIIHIADARCVRRWGTSQGLGQLAKDGPQHETKLEAPATVRVPIGSVVSVIPCEASKWT